jgi:hypothetical protein
MPDGHIVPVDALELVVDGLALLGVLAQDLRGDGLHLPDHGAVLAAMDRAVFAACPVLGLDHHGEGGELAALALHYAAIAAVVDAEPVHRIAELVHFHLGDPRAGP